MTWFKSTPTYVDTSVAIWKTIITDENNIFEIIHFERVMSNFVVHTVPVHYGDRIMDVMASQITSLMIVNSTVYSGAHQRKHQSSVSLAFVRGIHRWLVNSLHKGPVTRKMIPLDDVIMWWPRTIMYKDICRSNFRVYIDGLVQERLNSSPPSAAYMRHEIDSALVQIMTCCLFGATPLSKPILGYCQLDP